MTNFIFSLIILTGGDKTAKVIKEGSDLNWIPKGQKCGSCGTEYVIEVKDLRTISTVRGYVSFCPKCGHDNPYDGYPPDHIKVKIAWRELKFSFIKAIALGLIIILAFYGLYIVTL